MSQKMTSLSNRIQLGQRGVSTLRKTLNEVESQISDLDTAKEIAKKGNQCEREVKIEWRKTSQNGKKKRRKVRVITMRNSTRKDIAGTRGRKRCNCAKSQEAIKS